MADVKPDLEWWTVREAAARWRVSSDTVLRMIDRGDLAARKIGGQWRIHHSAIDQFERSAKPRSAPSSRPACVINGGDPLGLYSSSPAPSPARSR